MSCLAGPVIGRLWTLALPACQFTSASEFPTFHLPLNGESLRVAFGQIVITTARVGLTCRAADFIWTFYGFAIIESSEFALHAPVAVTLLFGCRHNAAAGVSAVWDCSFPQTVRCLSGSHYPAFDTAHWLKGTFSRISMPLRRPQNIIILSYLYVRAVGGTWIPAPARTLLAASQQTA